MSLKSNKGFAASDKRIAKAIEILSSHYRGNQVLAAFRSMMQTAGAQGLDVVNMNALQTLLNEAAAGRRDFLHKLPKQEASDVEESIESVARILKNPDAGNDELRDAAIYLLRALKPDSI